MFVASLMGSTVALIGEQADRDTQTQLSQELNRLKESTILAQIKEVQDEYNTTVARLNAGIGIAADNRVRLDELRSQQSILRERLLEAQKERINASLASVNSNESDNPLRFLAEVLGIEAEGLRLAYTFLLALLCDVGGLATGAAAIRRTNDRGPKATVFYLVVRGTSHILQEGSRSKTACARAYHGDIVTVPSGTICPECERSFHA